MATSPGFMILQPQLAYSAFQLYFDHETNARFDHDSRSWPLNPRGILSKVVATWPFSLPSRKLKREELAHSR